MTLIELLAVIVIITTIVAAAIPLLSPSNDDRRIREATRSFNTFLTGAQARAISLRRPVGVALKRLSQETKRTTVNDPANDNGMCVEAYYVEVPAPYAGLGEGSKARVAMGTSAGTVLIQFVRTAMPESSTAGANGVTNDGLPIGLDLDPLPRDVVRQGDFIEINGTRYRFIESDDAFDNVVDGFYSSNGNQTVITAIPVNDTGQMLSPQYDGGGRLISTAASPAPYSPFWANAAPYKILRQPAAMSDEPYQLPEGTAIDLRASGIGTNDYFYAQNKIDNAEGVLIMFAPEGRVSRVAYYRTPYNATPFDQPVNDNIYLLIGRADKVPLAVAADATLRSPIPTEADALAKLREPINWLSGNSRWIVIGSQSGRIATVENGAVDLASTLVAPPKPFNTATASTEEMRCAQIISAREHTQEVGQLGGR